MQIRKVALLLLLLLQGPIFRTADGPLVQLNRHALLPKSSQSEPPFRRNQPFRPMAEPALGCVAHG